MGSFVVGAMVLAVIGLAARSVYRDHKSGKALGCGDCSKCGGGCRAR